MSSAALQAAPRQPTSLSSPIQSPSNRQYTSSHSSPTNEAYHAQQPNTSSPNSRRPPSRKTSGNDPSPNLELNPRSLMYQAPTPPSEQHSPIAARFSDMPPVAPPRTSSTQQGGASRRGNAPSDRSAQSSRQQPVDQARLASHADLNGVDNSRAKRPITTHLPTEPAGRSPQSRDPRPTETALPIRASHQPTSSRQPREISENVVRAASEAEDPNGRTAKKEYQGSPTQDDERAAASPVVPTGQEERRGGRSRHEHLRTHRGTSKFGDFILGNTIGEGEFGKVKLGWKQDNTSVQVAIKLIKRDTVGSNPSRLAKIRREVTILREIHHPNIVRLIDMVETERYIGIILEYASGGELFDHILNHRYLKDSSARRLFSQLVSGVGYLHKKGIVHRDLKLENLLLDRNRNIIITDFGFANTFDPNEELAEEEELNLTDRDYVKRMGLDRVKTNGMRKGDLMQTSCGSPCYAAPELVVSDSLYTGRKVDVWSCGVILYAMLAGYLPFDDDPANPEGDNINLLYKYIVTTPLTFPEYVTPHARDLLRRILVPNPRKRADLFEVARHSWLSEYSHVVEFITSSTTLPSEVQNATVVPEALMEPQVTRSSSVREAARQKAPQPVSVGGLTKTHGNIDHEVEQPQRTPKDAKRRTVQVEYVAPTTQTQRGTDSDPSRTRTRSASRGRREGTDMSLSKDKPLPQDPPVSRDGYGRSTQSKRPPSAHQNTHPTRPSQNVRIMPDSQYLANAPAGARPQTGGSMHSTTSGGLQSRGNYGQPVPPAMADTNAQGRIQQPNNDEHEPMGRPSVSVPPKFANIAGYHNERPSPDIKGHKRSNTLGDIGSKLLGRSGSVFGGRNKKVDEAQGEKSKKYPPVSMSNAIPSGEEPGSRPSMDSKYSRRSFSLGLGKKPSGSMSGSQGSNEKRDRRRFSLLPPSFSLKAIGLGKEYGSGPSSEKGSQPDLPIQGARTNPPRSVTAHGDARGTTPFFDGPYEQQQGSPAFHQRHVSAQVDTRRMNAMPPYMQNDGHARTGSNPAVESTWRPPTEPQVGSYQRENVEPEGYDGRRVGSARGNRGVLQKNHKRFTDAYDQDGHEGSSGAAKRVMDFFRRRGKARGGDDR